MSTPKTKKILGAGDEGVLGPGMETDAHRAESEAYLAQFYATEEQVSGLATPEHEMPGDDPDADDEEDDKADDNDPWGNEGGVA